MKKLIFALIILAAMLPISASAQEWLVGMNEEAVMLAETKTEHIAADVYKTDYETAVSLVESGAARYMEPDSEVRLCSEVNDPDYSRQWGLSQFNYTELLDEGYTGEGVRVAVIDSGINAEHEDLVSNIAEGYDYINGDNTPEDEIGHGTFISGIIAAETNNGLGITGVAGKAQIIPLKCFDNETSTMSLVLEALGDIADGKIECDVLNLSWETEESPAMLELLEQIRAMGIIIVASVGNYDPEEVRYPAGYDCVIGVNSVDSSLRTPSFAKDNESVFISAAGRGIYSTWTGSQTSYASGKSGTSYSAPVISGLAAAAKEADPSITAEEFSELLKAAATDYGETGYDTAYGWGVVDFGCFARCLKAWELSESGDVQAAFNDSGAVVFGVSDAGGEDIVAAYDNGVLISWDVTSDAGRWIMTLAGASEDSEVRCFSWDSIDGMKPDGEAKIVNKIF